MTCGQLKLDARIYPGIVSAYWRLSLDMLTICRARD